MGQLLEGLEPAQGVEGEIAPRDKEVDWEAGKIVRSGTAKYIYIRSTHQ